jgi:hypothetical protein
VPVGFFGFADQLADLLLAHALRDPLQRALHDVLGVGERAARGFLARRRRFGFEIARKFDAWPVLARNRQPEADLLIALDGLLGFLLQLEPFRGLQFGFLQFDLLAFEDRGLFGAFQQSVLAMARLARHHVFDVRNVGALIPDQMLLDDQ